MLQKFYKRNLKHLETADSLHNHTVGSAIRFATKNPEKINALPKDLHNLEFYYEVVMRNARILKFIPYQQLTSDFCIKCLIANSESIKYIPQVFKNKELYTL